MATIEFASDKRTGIFGDWSRDCTVDGVRYQVSVRRGKPVRIPYKPRGKNRGWQWSGSVYSNGRCIWADRVPGSIGVKGLLLAAGVLAPSGPACDFPPQK